MRSEGCRSSHDRAGRAQARSEGCKRHLDVLGGTRVRGEGCRAECVFGLGRGPGAPDFAAPNFPLPELSSPEHCLL